MSTSVASQLPDLPRPGQVLASKYRIEHVLGVGGMGAVVAAIHLQLDERVAIKFLHAHLASNQELVTRFLREGRSCIKIRSEHAVKVHDVGTLENGAPYLVMEHLDGTDLAALVRNHGPLRCSDAVDFILQACEAIAEAHTLGIVHRDLKPANLFHTRRADGSPSIKVLDFGISKAASGDGSDLGMTKTQSVMGSPRYMSPEQLRSTRDVDQRTDIWAIGVILYELVCGATPFNAESMTELCAQILQDEPRPFAARGRHDAPPQLEAAVMRCLEKTPQKRFAHLGQLAMAIAEFASPAAHGSAERVARIIQARGMDVGMTSPLGPRSPEPGLVAEPRTPPSSRRPGDGRGASFPSGADGWLSAPYAVPKSGRRTTVIAGVAAVVVAAAIAAVAIGASRGSRSPAAPLKAAPSVVVPLSAGEGVSSAAPPPDVTLAPPRPPSGAPSVVTPDPQASSSAGSAHGPSGGRNPIPRRPLPPQPTSTSTSASTSNAVSPGSTSGAGDLFDGRH